MKRAPLVAGLAGGLALSALAAPAAATTPGTTPGTTPATGTPTATGPAPARTPVALGTGGAVATVDPDATRAGLEVLRAGGNAVDAAVAAAAALGVTEPYSAGIGGGGFFVYYDARLKRVGTIDGRETAPRRMRADSFVENGRPIPFDDAVTSGLSVGVPGTPATWRDALDRWGTLSLRQALAPAIRIADRGFVVDAEFRRQTGDNAARFRRFTSTRRLFLPGGAPPRVGAVLRNPDLAATYRLLADRGMTELYRGRLGREVVAAARRPPVAPGTTARVRPGLLDLADLARYTARLRPPAHTRYRGLDVYGMAPPSSGGTTVGEALNILERFPLARMSRTQAQHHLLEAGALAFADRNRYVGDPDRVDVPVRQLLSDGFGRERGCLIRPARTLPRPVASGDPDGDYRTTCRASGGARVDGGREGGSTTHLTTADRWGNVVAYTLTIEQTGGSGIVVPGRGFLLNNELTDFSFVPAGRDGIDPNLPAPGKRPRSSIAPTIMVDNGAPLLAVGSPGGPQIIATVLQVLVGRLDLGQPLPQAVAAPRAAERNMPAAAAEPAYDRRPLQAVGHRFTTAREIGAVTGIEVRRDGRLLAVAEPRRRGGGDARVLRPSG
ncbi:MAG: gamma-glutamyltransferase [Mycobacterium leprae]